MPNPQSVRSTAFIAIVSALAALGPSAEAKVAFTGYGDIRVTASNDSNIGGSPAAIAGFGIRDTTTRSRTARLENIGVFATTSLTPELDFLMDVTYREIAATPNQVRLQYAYLDYRGPADTRFSVGRFPLPFGFDNQNRFYAFQRPDVTPPVFINGILGLPISDTGAAAGKRQALGPLVLTADVFAVNGYGPTAGSTVSFRAAGFGGGLVIANNLGSRDANNRTALGGRLRLMNASENAEAGASYYSGHWDPAGNKLFRMANGHVHAKVAGFDLRSEYLLLKAEGDAGFAAAVAHPDWKTSGYFAAVAYEGWHAVDRPLIPWVRQEEYATIGDGGGMGREKLRGTAGGLAYQATDQLTLKIEVSRLYYFLPVTSVAGHIELVSKSYILGIAFTF